MHLEECAYVRSCILIAELTGCDYEHRAARSRELLLDIVPMRLNVLPRSLASLRMPQEIAEIVRSVLVANSARCSKLNRLWQNLRIFEMGKRSHVPASQNLIGCSIQ